MVDFPYRKLAIGVASWHDNGFRNFNETIYFRPHIFVIPNYKLIITVPLAFFILSHSSRLYFVIHFSEAVFYFHHLIPAEMAMTQEQTGMRQDLVIGLIGFGDMGQMYAKVLGETYRIYACDVPERYN